MLPCNKRLVGLLAYRNELGDVIAMVITGLIRRLDVTSAIIDAMPASVEPQDRVNFAQSFRGELFVINDGNFACYRVRPSQFKAWKDVWDE